MPEPPVGIIFNMPKSTNHPTTVITSETPDGLDLGLATQTWKKLAISELRLEMLSDLVTLDVGLNDIEEIGYDLRLNLRSEKLRNKSDCERKALREIMVLKMTDERFTCQELTRERNQWRRRLKEELGDHSRKLRSVIRLLRAEASREKVFHRAKLVI